MLGCGGGIGGGWAGLLMGSRGGLYAAFRAIAGIWQACRDGVWGRVRPQVMEGAPRVCGGGPLSSRSSDGSSACSPRVRGWSSTRRHTWKRTTVLPACAGVVPSGRRALGLGGGAPRVCGGGPVWS
ncbi:hypothetical protein C0Q92_12020 [Streptomyces albidoflavus]|uniref:Uncharacterized protein n=1 Tax=Streptomyces albidoflavus TaxID=1886 RepID=A0A8G1ZRZ9_9ACTN|nr:hypothetical protein C0Q92_12020 [Streptomyces albidoflavus]